MPCVSGRKTQLEQILCNLLESLVMLRLKILPGIFIPNLDTAAYSNDHNILLYPGNIFQILGDQYASLLITIGDFLCFGKKRRWNWRAFLFVKESCSILKTTLCHSLGVYMNKHVSSPRVIKNPFPSTFAFIASRRSAGMASLFLSSIV